MTRAMMLCLTTAALVHAAAAAPRKVVRSAGPPATAAEKTMATELRRGRLLVGKGKHADAIVAFQAGLAAVPDEPRLLTELGWELRVVGDLTRAEEVCRKAVQRTSEPARRAPALYNLGRVLEQRGDKPGAIDAYRQSLKLRENRIVRERLMDLDPTATSDAARPQPLEGPFPSVEAWCATQKEDACHLDDDAAGRAALPAPAGPWKAARVFTIGDSPQDCVLATQTSRGWFFARPTYCKDGLFRNTSDVELEARDLLKAPGPEIVVTFRGTDAMKDYDEEAGHPVCCIEADFSSLVVCGVGPSQVPSCTPALELLPPLEASGSGDVGLEPSWAGDELVLDRSDGKSIDEKKPRLAPSLRALAGRHRIAFP